MTLSPGAAGLTQALIATASVCPQAIREQVSTLANRLSSGAALTATLRSFADELADPAADVVVATLLMAATERAHRLGDLLGALAESTREEVAMRQAVEASRASARSAVRTVTGFSVGFLVLMVLFARSYLAPYGTPEGQAVLVVVGALFGLGLWLMAVMVRTRPTPRLFVRGADDMKSLILLGIGGGLGVTASRDRADETHAGRPSRSARDSATPAWPERVGHELTKLLRLSSSERPLRQDLNVLGRSDESLAVATTLTAITVTAGSGGRVRQA